jgi:hypothetical protein
MSLFKKAQSTALGLLTKFGEAATLRVASGSAFDPATQTNAPTYTDYPVRVYVGNYAGITNETGERIQTSDKKLIVSGAGVTLEPGMGGRVVVGATSYNAQTIMAIGGQGTQAIYIIQGRA